MARINTRVYLATTLLRRSPLAAFVAATASSSTPPPPIHLRISVALLAPKAFLTTAFLMHGLRLLPGRPTASRNRVARGGTQGGLNCPTHALPRRLPTPTEEADGNGYGVITGRSDPPWAAV